MKYKKQSAFTLIELTVVLLILMALAGLTIPSVSDTNRTALCNATDVTMQNIKKVIMERYYLDTLGYFPKKTKDKTIDDYNLTYLFESGDWQDFDPETQTGWRQDGYVQGGVALTNGKQYSAANLDASFPLVDGDTVVLDGWGRPIILQNSTSGFRLVSAGVGLGLGLNKAEIETSTSGNRPSDSDDRILYLETSSPTSDINPSCSS